MATHYTLSDWNKGSLQNRSMENTKYLTKYRRKANDASYFFSKINTEEKSDYDTRVDAADEGFLQEKRSERRPTRKERLETLRKILLEARKVIHICC